MTKLNVHQRMAKAMQEVTYIRKEQKEGMRYSIVSHDAVTAKVRPALLAAGVHYYPVDMTMTQDGNRTECTMRVRFVNIETPSDFFEVASGGYGIDPQDKGPGKAISYAVKYALLKAMGLETGDDPDLDQEVVHESKDDPHLLMIAMFKAELEQADTPEKIDLRVKDYTERLRKASSKFPEKVAALRAEIKLKRQAMEKAK